MTTAIQIDEVRRWSMLGLGVFAQASSSIFIHGVPFLLPALTDRGMPLATAGLLVAMPTIGLVCTLIAWGYVVDRIGERKVLVGGPLLMLAAGCAAAATTDDITLGTLLFLGGVGAASTNGASGRVIVGWFPPHRRGWRWVSGRPRSRSASASPRWRFPRWPLRTVCPRLSWSRRSWRAWRPWAA